MSGSQGYVGPKAIPLALLVVVEMGAAFARQLLSPLQETVRVSLNLSDNEMALLQGPALAIPVVLAAVPLGLAIDRYSRVRLLLFAGIICVLGSVLTALAKGLAALFAARCLVGLSATVINTAALSLIADLFAPTERGRAKAAAVIGQYAGMSAAFALGGWLLILFDSPDGWRSAMLSLVALLVFAFIAIVPMREPPRTGVRTQRASTRDSFVQLWQQRAIVAPLVFGLVMIEIMLFAVLTWAAPTFARAFDLPPDRIGGIMSFALVVTGLAGPVIGGVLADLCQRSARPRRSLLVLTLLAALTLPGSLFGLVPALTLASTLLMLLMLTVSATMAMGTTLFLVLIPNELRGLSLSILTAGVVLFGVASAPLMVSMLSVVMGGPEMIGTALASVCVIAMLLSVASFALGAKLVPGDIAR